MKITEVSFRTDRLRFGICVVDMIWLRKDLDHK